MFPTPPVPLTVVSYTCLGFASTSTFLSSKIKVREEDEGRRLRDLFLLIMIKWERAKRVTPPRRGVFSRKRKRGLDYI